MAPVPLSPTESRILVMKDQGRTYKEISAELRISINTVKTHVHRILVKSMAFSLQQAAYQRRQAANVPLKPAARV